MFSFFLNMKVKCVFSLDSPHRGDSNEYAQHTIFNMKMKTILNHPKSAAMGFFSKGLKNEFDTAVVNEPSVFEPLKFCCIFKGDIFVTSQLLTSEGRLCFSVFIFGLINNILSSE